MRKKFRQISVILVISILTLGCGKKYQTVDPGTSRTGQVHVRTQLGETVDSYFHYTVPHNYSAKQAFPLLVTLHGDGSNLLAFHEFWQENADSLGVIHLTIQGENLVNGGIGWSWGPHAEQTILASVDMVVQELNIDRSRIFLAGFSSGGRLAFKLGLKYPTLFQGAAVLGAPIDSTFVKQIRVLPHGNRFYFGHGEFEPLHEITKHCANRIAQIGGRVHYVVYPETGHALPEPHMSELHKILKFLLE